MPTHIATRLIDAASQIVLGKEHAVRLALACLLARGHLLIEDVPGVGKTTLAHALARLLGLRSSASSSPATCCPADILGVSVFDRGTAASVSIPGRCSAR
jgi:MoxR-like ATPase